MAVHLDRIKITQGDLTALVTDAIVNAANETLMGGSGVDGAIHRAAGPGLRDECRGLGGCKPGQAKITKGYGLAASHVIHTVGPVWVDGSHGEKEVLASCYRESLALAADQGLASLAFPAISTGVMGFPLGVATRIALTEVSMWLVANELPEMVVFCCFSQSDLETYRTTAMEVLA